jgi:hypothetical protein
MNNEILMVGSSGDTARVAAAIASLEAGGGPRLVAVYDQMADEQMQAELKERKQTLTQPMMLLPTLVAAGLMSDLPDVSRLVTGFHYQPGVPLGCGVEDGKEFTDSRGRKYVRVKGTIRRVKN